MLYGWYWLPFKNNIKMYKVLNGGITENQNYNEVCMNINTYIHNKPLMTGKST